jgi:hypothetical protein
MTLIIDPDHPGLYLDDDPALTVDSGDPGFYLTDDPELTPDPDHPGFYLFNEVPAEPFVLAEVVSSAAVSIGIHVWSPLTPLIPATISGTTAVSIRLLTGTAHIIEFDPIESSTEIRILSFPHVGSNTPILLAFSARMRLESIEPLVST